MGEWRFPSIFITCSKPAPLSVGLVFQLNPCLFDADTEIPGPG